MDSDRNNPYANLKRVEHALSLALEVPRTPPGNIVDTKEFLLDAKGIEKVHEDLKTAQAELGEPFVKLRELLRDQSSAFSGLCATYLRGRDEGDRLQQSFTINVDTWGCTVSHALQQRRLIDLLIELRHEIIESMKRLPHEMSGHNRTQVHWTRTVEGQIAVTVGSIVRWITEERLAWIFAEVASAGGRKLLWSELLTKRMYYLVEQQKIQEPENIKESSFERYGREIRLQLDPFGDLWEMDAKGARWRGDQRMTS